MTKPKATHMKGAAKGKKGAAKGAASTRSHALIIDRDSYNKRPSSVSKGKGKGKKNKKDGDNDDNDQLNKKRKESDEHNIDEYIKYHSDLKPSSKLLKEYGELDSRAAQLLFAENSGYDFANCAIILDELRSDDNEKRAAAIEKYLELIKTAIPNLNQQASIRDNYYALGGHHELVLQACGCCGRNDYKNILHGNIYDIGESFTSSVLRLDSTELKDYKHSRVEGYLNVTAMLYYANENKA